MPRWKGKFRSTRYAMRLLGLDLCSVMGDIVVDLPDDLTTTDSVAQLTYTGLYRRGHASRMSFRYDAEARDGDGSQVGVTYGGFKGECFANCRQQIAFSIGERRARSISGTYRSDSPADEGVFSLTMAEDP